MVDLSTAVLLVIFVGAIILIFAGFLKTIISVAEKKLKNDRPIQKEDTFFKEHGYSWDYCFVFQVWDEYTSAQLTPNQEKSSMKTVNERLANAGTKILMINDYCIHQYRQVWRLDAFTLPKKMRCTLRYEPNLID